jgi:hypothetical protein
MGSGSRHPDPAIGMNREGERRTAANIIISLSTGRSDRLMRVNSSSASHGTKVARGTHYSRGHRQADQPLAANFAFPFSAMKKPAFLRALGCCWTA